MKTKNNFKSGLFVLLPIIVFIWFLRWVYKLLLDISNDLLSMFPKSWTGIGDSVSFYWNIISIVVIVLVVLSIGIVVNHYYIGEKLKKITKPIIGKIPLLSTLFRIGDTFKNKGSFKNVVLIEYPVPGVYVVGYITNQDLAIFEEALGASIFVVFIPTAPNVANGAIVIVEKKKIYKIDAEVMDVAEFILSMGTSNLKAKKTKVKLVPGLGSSFFLD